MMMRMLMKRDELKMNDERAVKTPQGGDDRENSCLGKLPCTKTAPTVHQNCPSLHLYCPKQHYSFTALSIVLCLNLTEVGGFTLHCIAVGTKGMVAAVQSFVRVESKCNF